MAKFDLETNLVSQKLTKTNLETTLASRKLIFFTN